MRVLLKSRGTEKEHSFEVEWGMICSVGAVRHEGRTFIFGSVSSARSTVEFEEVLTLDTSTLS